MVATQPAELRRADIVRIIREHLESKFPKTCSNCGLRFDTLADYLRLTTHLGAPLSFDPPGEVPRSPVGTISLANCSCGTTLTLGSRGIPEELLVPMMVWARNEAAARSLSIGELLAELRDEVDRAVIASSS